MEILTNYAMRHRFVRLDVCTHGYVRIRARGLGVCVRACVCVPTVDFSKVTGLNPNTPAYQILRASFTCATLISGRALPFWADFLTRWRRRALSLTFRAGHQPDFATGTFPPSPVYVTMKMQVVSPMLIDQHTLENSCESCDVMHTQELIKNPFVLPLFRKILMRVSSRVVLWKLQPKSVVS